MRLASGLLLVGLGLAAATPAFAQTWADYDYENLEFRGISVELGWIAPSRVSNTLLLGLRTELGYLGPNLRLAPSLSFWSSELQSSEVSRIADQIQGVCVRQHAPAQCPPLNLGDVRMSDFILNVDAFYEFPNTPLLFIPYVGLGGGLHFLNSRGDLINGTFIEDYLEAIAPGFNLLGGLRFPMNESFELLAEGRYTLTSEMRYGGISAGVSWLFPVRAAPSAPAPAARRR